jgi:hypothetical protein
MGDGFVVRKGGGGGKLFAAIGVTYPEGNTCICSNGTKTLLAKAASGHSVFAIPKPTTLPENWTVTTTDGVDSKDQSVNIAVEGQCVLVNLKETVLFDRTVSASWIGKANTNNKGSAVVEGGVMSVTGAMDYGGYPEYYTYLRYYPERINITSAGSKLCISVSSYLANAKLVAFADPNKVCPGNTSITYDTAEVLRSQAITATGASMELPVGNYYVGILVDGNGQVSTPKVWIE